MDLEYLSKILPILRASGVSSFEDGGLSLRFYVEQLKPEVRVEPDKVVDVPVDEMSLPPDLRTDNITDVDKILHWSGSPDADMSQLPLTGDAPLEGL